MRLARRERRAQRPLFLMPEIPLQLCCSYAIKISSQNGFPEMCRERR